MRSSMPAVTQPSDITNSRRSSGRSAKEARWSVTRDAVPEGIGKRSSDVGEMDASDGTSLYFQENWPLVDDDDRNISPETVVSLGSSIERPTSSPRSPRKEQSSQDHAVSRKKVDSGRDESIFVEDKEVSELEEDSGRVSEDDADELYGESRGSSPVVPAKQSPNNLGLITSQPPDDSPPSSPHTSPNGHNARSQAQREQWRELQTARHTDHHDVSPIREEYDAIVGAERENGAAISEHERPNDQAQEPDLSSTDEDYENANPTTHSTPPPDDPPQSPSSYAISPQTTGPFTPIANLSSRHSSLMKSTPPSRSMSRRTPSITRNMPYDKSKIRYSWQSMQDEEPSRPRIHIIKLVSNTATASAGFPQGEAFGFSMSPQGRRLAVWNSARLYVLQTPALPVGISQDYALKRRPLAVEINDDGTMLAILMNEDTINVYDLSKQQLQRIRTIRTESASHCIALAPTGGLLAAGYEGGVEVFSLASSSMETDRRSFRSQRIDKLTFSDDGSTLLGTTTRINVSHTMVISVPLFPAAASGVPTNEELKHAWIFDVHHPENIRNSSHAVFMRENREDCNERMFAWNGSEDTFGILNVGDMQYGNVDFPVVISPPLSTCGGLGAAIHSCPAIDEHGDTVAMVVNDRTIRLYIVPHAPNDDETTIEAHSIDHELDEGYGCPFTEVRWVYNTTSLPPHMGHQTNVQGRLLVTSPGGVVDPDYHEESIDDIEGGRIILFDFDPQFAGQPGQTFSLTLGQVSQPQLLEEAPIDVAEEISLVRRRTVNQKKGTALSHRPIALGRAATTFGGSRADRQLRAGSPAFTQRSVRNSVYSIQSGQFEGNRSLPDLMETNEALDTFEEPYAQGAPRSQALLQRAASNAQRHRFQAIEERTQERVSNDSNGNFLPLPEYTEEPNAPLPSRFRAMAGLDSPAAAPAAKPAIVTNINGDHVSPASGTPSSAPAAVADGFSSESAFRAAAGPSRLRETPTGEPSTPLSAGVAAPASFSPNPISRSDTFESLRSIPRGLQRAYGNAPLSQSPVASNRSYDWENSSPTISASPSQNFSPFSQKLPWREQSLISPTSAHFPEDEPRDSVAPLPPRDMSRFARTQPGPTPNRYSTSQLIPPGHPGVSQTSTTSSSPMRAPSAASSYATMSDSQVSTASSRQRNLPPHIQSFQRAAAAANSASIFPSTRSSDHLPLRESSVRGAAGSVPHPVMAWHPPAPSIASAPPGSARGHSRKSSLSNRSAFASTERARNLGFFRTGTRKKKGRQLYGSQFGDQDGTNGPPPTRGGNESLMETRSIFTTFTRREGKCIIM